MVGIKSWSVTLEAPLDGRAWKKEGRVATECSPVLSVMLVGRFMSIRILTPRLLSQNPPIWFVVHASI
jgi:hypothetical protein